MPGYTFTDDVRRALQTAREEVAARHQAYVAPEHLLLALTSQRDATWSTVFKQLAVDQGALAQQMTSAMATPSTPGDVGPDFPYTPAAMRVLELATEEARDLGYAYVGAEHILLALVREGSSSAARVLASNRITQDRLRDALARWTPPSAG
jgi:ATP-dependent Clp protease ATP-binding subunit ClpA